MTAVEALQFTAGPMGDGPGWLRRIREEAIQRFEELGFPTTREEDWKFTNVAPIARTRFHPAEPASVVLRDSDKPRLVFVNGRYSPELSSGSLPVTSLRAALREDAQVLGQHMARYASYQDHAFRALNTAFFEDGAFIQIPKAAVIEEPIHLVFVSKAGERPAVSYPRNLILIGEDSQVAVVETYLGAGDGVYFTNAVTEIVAGPNAVVEHYKLQQESERAFHIASLQVVQGRDCHFTSHSISLGGALVRNDVNSVLSEGAECTLNGLYLVHGRQHVDNHTVIDHAKPHAASHELYKGILDGQSSAVFNGKILVRKDAQKTDAKQTNKNLVLSEDAVINTKPELQIYADDVRCTHGATIGQIDPDAIFYLRSRGIGAEQARHLLTYAFAREILDRMKLEPLRERLEQKLFERLHEHRQ
jgi:Fe-S cluster assembly protein SufD